MADAAEYEISCHCGSAAQSVSATPTSPGSDDAGISLCHCRNCRHNTGILCTSYLRIQQPPSLQRLRKYTSASNFHRYFCETCGCHVFRSYEDSREAGESGSIWAVATGVITKRVLSAGSVDPSSAGFQFTRHINVASTKDGGLSPYLEVVSGVRMETHQHHERDGIGGDPCASLPDTTAASTASAAPPGNGDALQAFCHCGNVRFHITHPNAASRLPHSGFSDLIVPFKAGPAALVQNPDDVKWWLRPTEEAPTHFLAGTCACRSCRLITGFEIQTWVFVPRANIFFHVDGDPAIVPLDFATLPAGILRSYESSPGVLRESCVKCGATVFWHDRWRPELIDVSVGLLDAPEGARAERWLDWWKGRVSFSEDAGYGREGVVAERAVGLIGSLERGSQ